MTTQIPFPLPILVMKEEYQKSLVPAAKGYLNGTTSQIADPVFVSPSERNKVALEEIQSQIRQIKNHNRTKYHQFKTDCFSLLINYSKAARFVEQRVLINSSQPLGQGYLSHSTISVNG
ncbi:MAG: hypothetical protein JAY94_04390 [Candidatus Thiodiazotropha endolucinida]|nr:hypothetical protein [Candidatus Thiodiazotropha taylori]MCW4316729.1 hypothetical protein [Candidatus Thiodiazotropha taylori]